MTEKEMQEQEMQAMDSSDCSHDCGSCSSNCEDRPPTKEEMMAPANSMSQIKKVIGIVSGKGGVGKSLVTSLMAVSMQRHGYETAILDGDITGPSIPKIFGIHDRAAGSDFGLIPCRTAKGIKMMSINLLLENETDPVVWRGPIVAGVIKQFWTDVVWENVDVMFVDMPPGTGDVPLTVFQSLPLDGIIVVTSPQELVSMIVAKAVNMAKLMEIPIVGIVENMSYVQCPDCNKQIKIFGESNIPEIAAANDLKVLARIPLATEIAQLCDEGKIEDFQGQWLDDAVVAIESLLK